MYYPLVITLNYFHSLLIRAGKMYLFLEKIGMSVITTTIVSLLLNHYLIAYGILKSQH